MTDEQELIYRRYLNQEPIEASNRVMGALAGAMLRGNAAEINALVRAGIELGEVWIKAKGAVN